MLNCKDFALSEMKNEYDIVWKLKIGGGGKEPVDVHVIFILKWIEIYFFWIIIKSYCRQKNVY